MTEDQIIGGKYHADQFSRAAAAVLVIDAIESTDPAVVAVRNFYHKEMRRQLDELAAELGLQVVARPEGMAA